MLNPVLVHDYLTLSAQRFPDKEALICGKERWSYKDINQYSDRLACFLRNAGMNRHDRVAVFLDNTPESVVSLYGVLKAGGIFVILNSLMKERKLRYIINDCSPAFLITHTDKAELVGRVLDGYIKDCRIIWVGDTACIPGSLSSRSLFWNDMLQVRDNPDNTSPQKQASRNGQSCIDLDLAALVYTSSSTGEPKGVMCTHYNMVSAARSIIQYIGNTSDDIVLNVLPLSFDYGLYQVIMAFMFGGTVVLENSFLYPVKILKCIENERVTGFPIVPTIAALLLRMQSLSKYDMSSLRYITNTAAALPVEHIRRLKTILPQVKLYSMYGLTECKRVSYLPPDELDKRPASVGKAIPNCEVFVVDEHGKKLAPGETGELVIRGANVMSGYWNSPELTSETFREGLYPGERLLYSGDLFKQDEEGYLYFVGRKDDMIKTKGERVSPREVENVICEIDGVLEAVVIGVPDDVLGEAVKAFIVRQPGKQMAEKDIMRHCMYNLEPFMVPKYVEFTEELPRTPNGKIDRKALKTEAIHASAKPRVVKM